MSLHFSSDFFAESSGSTSSKCLYERDEAQAIARRPTVGIFIPDCKGDGTFAEVQCHAATGYCWCVDKGGKPILGTSTDGKKPKCKGVCVPHGLPYVKVVCRANSLQLKKEYTS